MTQYCLFPVATKPKRKRYCNKEKKRDTRLRRIYGLSRQDYLEILERQNNRCACCGLEFTIDDKDVMDHDHFMGNNRGIIHDSCNRALGIVQDQTWKLEKLIEYIDKHSCGWTGEVQWSKKMRQMFMLASLDRGKHLEA